MSLAAHSNLLGQDEHKYIKALTEDALLAHLGFITNRAQYQTSNQDTPYIDVDVSKNPAKIVAHHLPLSSTSIVKVNAIIPDLVNRFSISFTWKVKARMLVGSVFALEVDRHDRKGKREGCPRLKNMYVK